ncbi:hypothetical protein GN958_ATG03399, partial [Phytophthora infestans]
VSTSTVIMPRGTAKSGAKTRSMAAAGKAQAKSTKPHGKGSALKEATQVASEAFGSSGDAAVDKRASKRRSPSPSSSDNRPNPRFVEREFNSGSEAESESTHDAPAGSVGGHSPVPSEHKDDSVQSLASDQGDHSPRTYVRSESPAVKAKGAPKAGGDEEENPRKRLSLAEGLARAKASKAEGAKPSKKRTASKSPLREEKGLINIKVSSATRMKRRRRKKEEGVSLSPGESRMTSTSSRRFPSCPAACVGGRRRFKASQGAAINSRGYWPPRGEALGLTSFGRASRRSSWRLSIYERALVQKEQLFVDNLEAARCVLLAPHRIPLKDFTTCRKKPETRGGLYPLWGYPWVMPESCPTWSSCEDMFWAWVETLKYSPTELRELHEDQLLSRILDQRDLRVRFAHLISKRMLPRDILKRAASSAHDERGYGMYLSSVPRSGKKPRTTYEATAASVPRLRQPSGSQSGAVQSAPTSSRSGHNPSTSRGAVACRDTVAPGGSAPRGSGLLHSGQAGAEVPSYEYEYLAPPESHSRPSAPTAGPTQDPEVDRLRQRVLVLEIALGLETGGNSAAQARNQGELARLAGRLDLVEREVASLHLRVDRRASSSDLDEAFRMIRRIEALLPRPEPPAAHSQTYAYGAYPAYSAYSAYGAGVRSYGAPPAYGLDRSLAVPTEAWVPAPTTSSTTVTGPRFEELGQGGSASQQPPAGQSTA